MNIIILKQKAFYLPVKTLRPKQNGCQFAEDIIKLIFLPENCCILIQILLKFIPNWFR